MTTTTDINNKNNIIQDKNTPLAPLAPIQSDGYMLPLEPIPRLEPLQSDESMPSLESIPRLEPLQSDESMPSLEPIPRLEPLQSFRSMPALEPLESNGPPITVQERYEFNLNTYMTRENFPSATQLRQFCDENNFSSLLNMLKNKIFSVNINMLNNNIFSVNSGYPTSIRVMINDTSSYPPESVIEVKNFLNARGFNITEIENNNGIYQGWKLSW